MGLFNVFLRALGAAAGTQAPDYNAQHLYHKAMFNESVGYGHTRLNAPDLVRSRKLNNRRPGYWLVLGWVTAFCFLCIIYMDLLNWIIINDNAFTTHFGHAIRSNNDRLNTRSGT